MMLRMVEQRGANADYALSNTSFKDLSIDEYRLLCQFLGPAIVVADFERFIEGEGYNTLSIARPMCVDVLDYLESDAIACPKVSDPLNNVLMTQSDFTGVAHTFLKKMTDRARKTVKDDMPVAEAIGIILDPRIKQTFFKKMCDRYGEYWSDLEKEAIGQLKARLARAQKFDQGRVDQAAVGRTHTSPVPATAPTANRVRLEERDEDESNVEVAQPPAKVRRGLGAFFAAVPAPVITPIEASATAVAHDAAYFAHVADTDVEAYLRAPIVEVALYPTTDTGKYWDPIDYWLHGTCVPPGAAMKPFLDGAAKKHSYIAASAVAYHGGNATAGRPERLFRDVGFLNGVLQQRMLPSTISRLSMLKKNKDYRIPVKEVVEKYIANHPNSHRRGKTTTGVTAAVSAAAVGAAAVGAAAVGAAAALPAPTP